MTDLLHTGDDNVVPIVPHGTTKKRNNWSTSGKRITPEQWLLYDNARDQGYSQRASAVKANFSYDTAKKRERFRRMSPQERQNLDAKTRRRIGEQDLAKLANATAKKAAYNIDLFAQRYYGFQALPWQMRASEKIQELSMTADEEFLVVNLPPGSGKSAWFTRVVPTWLTVNDRSIRGQIGSVTGRLARHYVRQLRAEFQRTIPIKASQRDKALGLSWDAESTLPTDYGVFNPGRSDLWTADAFTVVQHDGSPTADKEPTWSSYGRDMEFLGMRYDYVIWDDVQVKLKATDDLYEWWDNIAESRIEPGGLLVLQGQRLGPDDIYRHCLDKKLSILTEEEMADLGAPVDKADLKKYHHLCFPAHDDTICKPEHHSIYAKPWPGSCLLSPMRLSSKKLAAIKANNEYTYRVLYQQEDLPPGQTLVDPVWLDGGVDKDGVERFGCYDRDRDLGEVPSHFPSSVTSIVTVDPGPANLWGIIWWLYDPASETRVMVDFLNVRMKGSDLLDWDHASGSFTGVMEQWRVRSALVGRPIKTWIIEVNAAQRFLLQYDHVRRWRVLYGIDVIPHTTGTNKLDVELGVSTIGSQFANARYRLPYKEGLTRTTMKTYTDEITRYPYGRTNDLVVSTWFLEWHLPRLRMAAMETPTRKRPSWLKRQEGSKLLTRR